MGFIFRLKTVIFGCSKCKESLKNAQMPVDGLSAAWPLPRIPPRCCVRDVRACQGVDAFRDELVVLDEVAVQHAGGGVAEAWPLAVQHAGGGLAEA